LADDEDNAAKRAAKLARAKFADRGRPDEPSPPLWKRNPGEGDPPDGPPPQLVMVGDSIAKNWMRAGAQDLGLEPVASLAGAGYFVQNVLWRVQSSRVDLSQARAVVLQAGTNNLSVRDPIPDIVSGFRRLVELLRERAPQASLYVMHVPARREPRGPVEAMRRELNAEIDRLGREMGFLTVEQPDQSADAARAYRDNIHLSAAGYAAPTAKLRAAMSHAQRK
jgi:lysophospholipase L1-like esterase